MYLLLKNHKYFLLLTNLTNTGILKLIPNKSHYNDRKMLNVSSWHYKNIHYITYYIYYNQSNITTHIGSRRNNTQGNKPFIKRKREKTRINWYLKNKIQVIYNTKGNIWKNSRQSILQNTSQLENGTGKWAKTMRRTILYLILI